MSQYIVTMLSINVTNPEIVMKSMIDYVRHYYSVHQKTPIQMEDHPFSRKNVIKFFGTWSNLLNEANLVLNRNNIYILKCKECKKKIIKQYKEYIKTKNDFCSHHCSAKFNNRGRAISDETREKIRQKLTLIRYTECEICHIEFRFFKRKRMTCGSRCLSLLKKRNNDIKYGRVIPEY